MYNLNSSNFYRQHILSLLIFFILILSFLFIKMQIRFLGYKVLKKTIQVQSLQEKLVLKKTKYVSFFTQVKGLKKEQLFETSRKIIYIIGDSTIID